MNLLPKETIGYVNQYGGNCRDCADNRGVCPVSGLPCAEREKAIKWVVDAINYGVGAGFLRPSIPRLKCTWPDCDQPSGHDYCYEHCVDNTGPTAPRPVLSSTGKTGEVQS